MTRELTLSQQVRDFIGTLDFEGDLSPEVQDEATQSRKMVEKIVDDIITSREMVTDNKFATLEKRLMDTPELIEVFLDDRFTRDVVNAVEGYVKRTMQFSRLEGTRIPSSMTNGYLREAARTYIFGFPQASIALSRAALEQALKEELGIQGKQIFVDMNNLLDEAEGAGVINDAIRKTARKIASRAAEVLHEKPADPQKAYEVLILLRGVLQHIYGQ
jgi:hypothetical protein